MSEVAGGVGEVEQVRVPAGTFETYRIVYQITSSKGAEPYEIRASKEIPRIMIREQFPGGMAIELVELSGLASE